MNKTKNDRLAEEMHHSGYADARPLLVYDADRLIASLEASRLPWSRLMTVVAMYAERSDCFYRRAQVGQA